MCGRFTLTKDVSDIIEHLNLTSNVVLKPRYNIAPNQVIPTMRTPGLLEFLTWGLRPIWLKDDQSSFINARVETLHEKPAFAQAFKTRRCLIIADGYYEWKTIGKIKQPFYITLPERNVFAFAGLWENDSCAIITKTAQHTELFAIHERAPILLSPDQYSIWLDPKAKVLNLQACLQQNNFSSFIINPVTTRVNNPKHDFVECIAPLQ